ncbi:MAG: DNA topoisomerase IV subunit B [Methylophilaceae bacterium]|nr:DNA topoisomerase IV subunit B [Methylophilaceae bacterium]
MAQKEYDADSVKVLRGLEPVRARPGMYTRTDSPTHIVQEVIDNAADEALGGHATNIHVTIYKDGAVQVSDNGRGIPVQIPTGETQAAVELVFVQLHAGGKFDKEDESSSYRFSGGLHGVGVSVTNALSTRLEVQVKRDGNIYQIAFANGERVQALEITGKCAKKDTGTSVKCWPDPQYFDAPRVSLSQLEHLIKSKAVLLRGVTVTLSIESENGFDEKSWTYTGGLPQYLDELIGERQMEEGQEAPIPIISGEFYAEENADAVSKGEGAIWALSFGMGGGRGESYVNLIPTLSGGTHEAGMRNGVFEAVKTFMEHHSMMQRGVKISAEDVWNNVCYVLAAKVLDPQFQGQTKEKLTNRDAMKMIAASLKPMMENWLTQNIDFAKRISDLVNSTAAARNKSTQKIEKRKSTGINLMPAKLTDCEAAGTLEAELFLVEGDSAGGSAKMGRNNEFQSLLPLRGKVLNTWEVEAGRIFANSEVHDIFVALGIEPHTMQDEPDFSGLRYGKLCLLSDADVDGSHIQVLLLTLFLKHAPKLIERGHVYISQPPLYRIDVPAQGKNKPIRKLYVADDLEKMATIEKLKREGIDEEKLSIQRFKGLGEMNPEQLWETTLCPDTRRLIQVRLPEEASSEAFDMFNMLMAKNQAPARKEWIERRGNDVEADV